MNWLDILIIIALLIQIFIGFRQGLIEALFSLIGITGGILLASNFYEPVAGVLGFIPNRSIANVIAFVVILAAVMVVAFLIGRILKAVVSATMFGWLDHLAGAVFEFAMGILLWSVLLALWVKFFGSSQVSQSLLGRILLDRFPLILGLLPSQFDIIRSFFN
ncbi:MAG: CvpA family protein [Dehalococcoidales bacterium]|nr:CvpA family protein [Dehalococcoidales bacterium]